MKSAAVIFAYVLCTSCVMTAEDPFVKTGGLQDLRSREQMFERDVRLALASSTPAVAFDDLSPRTRNCVVTGAIDHAPRALLVATDEFIARQSQASWSAYREASSGEDAGIQPDRLRMLVARCESPIRTAAAG